MSAVVSPVAGTRNEPMDSYIFIRGTTATFKIVFTNSGVPTTVDAGTAPVLQILEPQFLSKSGNPLPNVIANIEGTLVPGQQYEYQFVWTVPTNQVPLDNYIASYRARIGSVESVYGDEMFTISAMAGTVGIKTPTYATVDDVRARKFNIDSFLPESANTLVARNNIIEKHLRDASHRLREELSLFKARSNSENYRLFTIFYTVWSILMASRGEDSSAVSDDNLRFWRSEWTRILAQEKREGSTQGIPLGRG